MFAMSFLFFWVMLIAAFLIGFLVHGAIARQRAEQLQIASDILADVAAHTDVAPAALPSYLVRAVRKFRREVML